ncbi:MAG: hypothetical protein LBF51_02945 [Zoogloeaceae bacterium]|jgi:hypothetical protein|nr:hypothetical protein [Zoogloeaceae bacterium]
MLSAISFSPFFVPPYTPGGGQASAPAGDNAAARQEVSYVVQIEGSGERQKTARPERTEQANALEGARRTEEKQPENTPDAAKKPNGEALSEEEQREVTELAAIDRKVRQHEMAHMAAGGELITSGARYEYQQGPDGQRYAVAGEVGIDTSEGRTPEETLIRARRIRAAALAPADPSPQDRSVAAAATQMEIRAQQEIAQNRQEEQRAAEENANPRASTATHAYQDMSGSEAGQQNRLSIYA